MKKLELWAKSVFKVSLSSQARPASHCSQWHQPLKHILLLNKSTSSRLALCKVTVVRPRHSVWLPKIRLTASGTDLITILRCFLLFKAVVASQNIILVSKKKFQAKIQPSWSESCTLSTYLLLLAWAAASESLARWLRVGIRLGAWVGLNSIVLHHDSAHVRPAASRDAVRRGTWNPGPSCCSAQASQLTQVGPGTQRPVAGPWQAWENPQLALHQQTGVLLYQIKTFKLYYTY
jgi:hypothetical protein